MLLGIRIRRRRVSERVLLRVERLWSKLALIDIRDEIWV
jgi:hypothetical protein